MKKKSAQITPMMKQYMKIKNEVPDHILFYRLGDFYEMFFNDAVIASKVLNLTLTSRGKHLEENIPLAGFPHHQIDDYLAKMIRAGYKVAVCEQTEDPKKAKGVVKREIIEKVTAGTVLSGGVFDDETNNYLLVIGKIDDYFHFAVTDIATGIIEIGSYDSLDQIDEIINIYIPKEIIVMHSERKSLAKRWASITKTITVLDDWKFDFDYAIEIVKSQFSKSMLQPFKIKNKPLNLACVGVLLEYVNDNLKKTFNHFHSLQKYHKNNYLHIDSNTSRNLELFKPLMTGGNQNATLISVLSGTKTKMGKRLLHNWMKKPLIDCYEIEKRYDFITILLKNKEKISSLQSVLEKIGDLEKLASLISTSKIRPAELLKLEASLSLIPELKILLSIIKADLVIENLDKLNSLEECVLLIKAAIKPDAGLKLSNGNFINEGYSDKLDEQREVIDNSKEMILQLQNKAKKELGIDKIKIGFNKVFGYYFEVSRKNSNLIPSHYIKKQTLVNGERFINQDLKELEDKILNADEIIATLETNIFQELLIKLKKWVDAIITNSNQVAIIDVLVNFSRLSIDRNYTRPTLTNSYILDIRDGRHPVVERMLGEGEEYIANDICFTPNENILILTGPNMSGKSTYLRQTALMVIMAQMGCFIPCSSANIGVFDKIFTRVGASDNLAAGESTFLVEMNEAAYILNNATPKSLIILDEIGRGTSTFDGLSLAWSIVEYIHNQPSINSRTLFATHYHELIELDKVCHRVGNYSVSVAEHENQVVFMRKIRKGGTDNSYGIYVAQLAGMPKEVIKKAQLILDNLLKKEINLEKESMGYSKKEEDSPITQLSLFSGKEDKIREKLKDVDILNITPIEAISILDKLKKLV